MKWTKEMPTEQGLWEFRCGETNNEPTRCALCWRESHLYVHDEHIGSTTIEHFHGGLTAIEWRRVA